MTKRLWSTKHYMLVALVVFLMVKKSMMNHERGKVISIQMNYIRGRRTLIYSAKVVFQLNSKCFIAQIVKLKTELDKRQRLYKSFSLQVG